jgi:glycosyltransferase involved in cell wall biosynthesis
MNSTYEVIDETLKKPIVSIAMLTYNHEAFIREAIDSVLMQKTNFAIQLVIAEDCSPDNTKSILLDYQNKYPDIIKLILQNKNVGAQTNNQALFENLDGRYIAALEGDDYWIDPFKLQKQVDFLEKNGDFSMCFHNVSVLTKENNLVDYWIPKFKTEFDINDIINFKMWFIPTGAILYRNVFVYPEIPNTIISGDVVLCLLLADKGKIKLLPDVMSTYRQHTGGATSQDSGDRWLYGAIDRAKFFNKYFNYKYKKLFNEELFNTYGKLALYNSHLGKFNTFYYLFLSFNKVHNFTLRKFHFNYYFINSFKNFVNKYLKRK